jgi:hypothetical protein
MAEIFISRKEDKKGGFTYTVRFPNNDVEDFWYQGGDTVSLDIDIQKVAKEKWIEKQNLDIVLSNGNWNVKLDKEKAGYSVSGKAFAVINNVMEEDTVYSPAWNTYKPEEELARALNYLEKNKFV